MVSFNPPTTAKSSLSTCGWGYCDITHSHALWLASHWREVIFFPAAYSEKLREREREKTWEGRTQVERIWEGKRERETKQKKIDAEASRHCAALSHTHTHTQTVIASRVLSHHTPKLLNRQENHWVWLSLQPATAGQDRGRQNVKGDRRNKRVVLSSLFYLSATVPLLSSQEVRCFRELFKDTSPRKKGGWATRAGARASVTSPRGGRWCPLSAPMKQAQIEA